MASEEKDERDLSQLTEPDAMLLDQLSALGVDLDAPRVIEYGFVGSSVDDCQALCLCLQGMGHEFVDMPSEPAFADEDRAGCWVESSELISPTDAAKKTNSLRLIASEFHCKYDGWSTAFD
jgi:hypothetical protein